MQNAMKRLPPGLEALSRDRLTGVGKAARELGVGEQTIRRAIAAGELPTYVIGQQRRLRIVDIRAWLERCRR